MIVVKQEEGPSGMAIEKEVLVTCPGLLGCHLIEAPTFHEGRPSASQSMKIQSRVCFTCAFDDRGHEQESKKGGIGYHSWT